MLTAAAPRPRRACTSPGRRIQGPPRPVEKKAQVDAVPQLEKGPGTVAEQHTNHGDSLYGHRALSRELIRDGRQLGACLANAIAAQPDLRPGRRFARGAGDPIEVASQDGALLRPRQDVSVNGQIQRRLRSSSLSEPAIEGRSPDPGKQPSNHTHSYGPEPGCLICQDDYHLSLTHRSTATPSPDGS
jgi:hypothetical protein